MSGISPRPDQQTDSETLLLRALDALSISSVSQAIRKSGVSAFANISTGGSGTVAVETPPETPDGSRLTFTVAFTPLFLSVDDGLKFENVDYTYSSGTITITNGSAPTRSIQSIHN